MSDNNTKVAKEIVKQLKAEKLITNEEINLENIIANGTIRESDWKLLFEQQIINAEKQAKSETE
jgi:spermidine/putrescine-binding protein